MRNIKLKLSTLYFTEFAVWGAYLISLGNFLVHAGLAREIFWFYSVQGIISMVMPLLVGMIADRLINPKRMMRICHIISFLFKSAAVLYCVLTPVIEFLPLFILFTIGLSFYLPTIGMCNSITFSILSRSNLEPDKHFPRLRFFGTLGFIAAMLAVNFITIQGVSLQQTPYQLLLSALLSGCVALLSSFLPDFTVESDNTGNNYLKVFKETLSEVFRNHEAFVFLVFCFLIGICLQITNSYGNTYISFFGNMESFADTWGTRNANALISVSQVSEAACILLLPFFLKRFSIKTILMISIFAWSLRYVLFAIGNTGSGLIFLVLSMLVYGIAFDFLNIAGAIYIDNKAGSKSKNSAQGIFMMVTGGLGASIGTPLAGLVVNHFVFSNGNVMAQYSGWQTSWWIFAGYALILLLFFYLFFSDKNKKVCHE